MEMKPENDDGDDGVSHGDSHSESGLGFSSSEDVENMAIGGYGNPYSAEVRKRKRKRRDEKPSSEDEDLEIKKSKRDEDEQKSSDCNLGLETGGLLNQDVGMEVDGAVMKKRKRAELEDRRYGVVATNDEGDGEGLVGGKVVEKRRKIDDPVDMMMGSKEGFDDEEKLLRTMFVGNLQLNVKKRKRNVLEDWRYGVVAMNHEGGEEGVGWKVGEKRKKIDDPVDMMVSKEGFDDEERLLRTAFVGNLPLKVKKKALLKEFSQFGEIESVRIGSIPLLDTKRTRKGGIIRKRISDAVDWVHAYIVFKTEQAAQASLDHNLAVVGGNHIRVDRACPPHKKLKGENAPLYDNKRTVFVGNLPFDVKDEEIYQFYGIKDLDSSIEAVRVIRDSGTCVGKGIAYVLFKTRGAANLVIGKRTFKLRDRELRFSHTKSNLTPSKRKNPSPGDGNDSPTKKLAVDLRTPDSSNEMRTKYANSCVFG